MGKKNYTNGVETKRFFEGEEPEGWYRGVAPWSDEKKKQASQRRKETFLSKYGVENISQAEEVKDKKKETMLKNYGVESPLQSKELREKAVSTTRRRYGVDYARQSEEVIEKAKETCLEKYGVEHPMQSDEVQERYKSSLMEKYGVDNINKIDPSHEKSKKTSMERYGVDSPNKSEDVKSKKRETLIEHYGVESPLQSEDIQDKFKQTCIERFGVDHPSKSDEIKSKKISSNLHRYGVECNLQDEEVKKRISETCLSKYGVPWSCMRPEARVGSNDSEPNRRFANILDSLGVVYEREFRLDNYSYDFRVGKILVEIDPTVTHNILWNPFGEHNGVDKEYHYNKSSVAEENGYRCIHIFDWDDVEKVVMLLQKRDKVYARNCTIREVTLEDSSELLNKYHLQGTCRGQDIRLGLYLDDELVSLMTFGKPRYNKNYDYELLRYVSSKYVIGGAEKLFKRFRTEYRNGSVISYCDKAKFNGDVYTELGFEKEKRVSLSKHWYSPKESRHITDNLLRQNGYDRLFNESYGKGTSNEELIIARGFLPVYDCGQDVWILKR